LGTCRPGGCCEEREHISNRFERDYKEKMVAKLAEMRTNFKNYLFMHRMLNVVVRDPAVDMRGRVKSDVWGGGVPVHPKDELFTSLAQQRGGDPGEEEGRRGQTRGGDP
jgi:hypothetical protein